MNELKGACIIGQSGGPTSVINASVYGVIDTALKNPNITKVYGAEHGIKGVLADRLFDMSKEDLVSSCEIKSAHAVAMAGVRLDKDGKPEKWLVENSFGEERGWSGFVVMQNGWLEKYMFRLVVEKQFVPQEIQKLLDMKPKVLKSWNPTY